MAWSAHSKLNAIRCKRIKLVILHQHRCAKGARAIHRSGMPLELLRQLGVCGSWDGKKRRRTLPLASYLDLRKNLSTSDLFGKHSRPP